jgi:hypothetical protein
VIHLRLILRGDGQSDHQWGFFPDTAPAVGDYIYPHMVDMASGDIQQIRVMVRSRSYWPKALAGVPDHLSEPVDEYHCEVTTDDPIGEQWFADSELWTAQELYQASKLKESGQ